MRVTMFASALDRSASTHEVTWPELCSRLISPPVYPSKSDCPLLKLATFGNTPSPKGFLRHDANVVAISGIELDYDGEELSINDAFEALCGASLVFAIYTSASYSDEKPRWRVLLPLRHEYPPEYRRAFVAYVDGVLGNVCARESYALSQAYYVGRVEGVKYFADAWDGFYLDDRMEPVAETLDTTTAPDVPEWRHVELDALPIDDETRSLIRGGAAEGERSEALMTAANALARARVHPDDILRVLSDPAYAISAKALERRRQSAAMDWLARHTVRKALEHFPPLDVTLAPPDPLGETVARRRLLVSGQEIVARPREPNWLVADFLEKNVLGMVFGDPGSGKSFILLDWSLCVASGVAWNGHDVAAGSVVYVAGEGHGGLARRLEAWSLHRGQDIPATIHFSERAVAFNDPRAIGELVGEIDALPQAPALIVVDTLARATPGADLDKGRDMGQFVGACDRLRERYGCAVLVVHHSGHGDKGRAMNSIALKGACDFEAGIMRESKAVLRLTCTKMKDGEEFPDTFLEFHTVTLSKPVVGTDGLPRTQRGAVLVECDAPTGDAPRRSKGSDLLIEIVGEHDGSIDDDDARERFIQAYGGERDTARRAYYRARRNCVSVGAITYDSDATRLSAPI